MNGRVIRIALSALSGAAFILTASVSSAASEVTLRVVNHAALRALDPITTTAAIARDHGYMIYDTLFGTDEQFEIQPQMVEDWTVSADELTYSFRLREGLKFHDGAPVDAEDVVASLKRWGERDTMGQKLMENTSELRRVDQRVFELVLARPYGLVLDSLGKPSGHVPFIMPQRMAETPSDTSITEHIGSGPFIFVEDEYQPGVRAVYVKNPDYIPRSEPPSLTAGGKVVKVDRVEWISMPDHQTAVNALINGEIDYMELPPHDLYPILEAAPGVEMQIINKIGYQGFLRINHLHPPFDDLTVRRAAAYALNNEDYMMSWISDPQYRRACMALYGCGTPLATDAGSEGLMQGNLERGRELLEESGYDGTTVVIFQPTDLINITSFPAVTAQALRAIGMTVEVQAMDWGTMVSRRTSQEPPSNGGWSIIHIASVIQDLVNPVVNFNLNTKGPDGGYFGWPTDETIEELRDAYSLSTDPDEQKEIATEIQKRVYEIVAYLPLGEQTRNVAYRDYLSGVLDSPGPVFWNIEKSQ